MVSVGAGNKIIMGHMSIVFGQSCLLGRTDGVSLVFLIGQPDFTLCVGCRNVILKILIICPLRGESIQPELYKKAHVLDSFLILLSAIGRVSDTRTSCGKL